MSFNGGCFMGDYFGEGSQKEYDDLIAAGKTEEAVAYAMSHYGININVDKQTPESNTTPKPPSSGDNFNSALNTYNPNFFNPGYQVWENNPNGQQNPSYIALQNALQGGGTTLGNFAKDFGTQNQASIDQLSR